MSVENQKKCLVVLGMHRSGTSALAGLLQLLGVDLGHDLIPPDESTNPKGFFENMNIIRTNEALLQHLHSSWENQLLLPENWWQQSHLFDHKNKIIRLLQQEFNNSELFGIKDPRLCLLLPLWQEIFQELHIIPYYLIMIRHPLEVAASLDHREHFSYQKSVILWMNAMLSAELYSRNCPRLFIVFEDLLKNPQKILTTLSDVLALSFPRRFEEIEHAVHKFLTPGLKHHSFENTRLDHAVPPLISQYYQVLKQFAQHDDKHAQDVRQIDKIRKAYHDLSDWFYNKDIRQPIETFYYGDMTYNFQELHAQLCIDTGQGFHEEHTIIKTIAGDEQTLEFDLRAYRDIKSITLYPLNKMVVLRLKQIDLLTADHLWHRHVNYATNALYQQDELFVFETHEPSISIDLNGCAQLNTLVIYLEYLAWAKTQYQDLMMAKDAKIQQQAQLIKVMENMWSWRLTKPLRTIRNNPRLVRVYSVFLRYLHNLRPKLKQKG